MAAIDRTSGQLKHVITQHNNAISTPSGGMALVAYTYCGWLATEELETGYCYGGWYLNPEIPDVCPHCLHLAQCEADPEQCEGCQAADSSPSPYPVAASAS